VLLLYLKVITHRYLIAFIAWDTAVLCANCQSGFDAVFPYLFGSIDMDKKSIGFIVVQIKNDRISVHRMRESSETWIRFNVICWRNQALAGRPPCSSSVCVCTPQESVHNHAHEISVTVGRRLKAFASESKPRRITLNDSGFGSTLVTKPLSSRAMAEPIDLLILVSIPLNGIPKLCSPLRYIILLSVKIEQHCQGHGVCPRSARW
jgi:hypothetical protein